MRYIGFGPGQDEKFYAKHAAIRTRLPAADLKAEQLLHIFGGAEGYVGDGKYIVDSTGGGCPCRQLPIMNLLSKMGRCKSVI